MSRGLSTVHLHTPHFHAPTLARTHTCTRPHLCEQGIYAALGYGGYDCNLKASVNTTCGCSHTSSTPSCTPPAPPNPPSPPPAPPPSPPSPPLPPPTANFPWSNCNPRVSLPFSVSFIGEFNQTAVTPGYVTLLFVVRSRNVPQPFNVTKLVFPVSECANRGEK